MKTKFDVFIVMKYAYEFCNWNTPNKILYVTKTFEEAHEFIMNNCNLIKPFPGWDPVNYIMPVKFNTILKYGDEENE